MATLSARARPYRLALWVFLVLALPLLVLAVAGLTGVVGVDLGIAGLSGFFACLLLVVFCGLRLRQVMLEERDRAARSSVLVTMVGMLKHEEEATLERIARSGGPAGEAAGLLLQRRRGG